jgi:hypothetical protein
MLKFFLPFILAIPLFADVPWTKEQSTNIYKVCLDGKVWYTVGNFLTPKLIYISPKSDRYPTQIYQATCKESK